MFAEARLSNVVDLVPTSDTPSKHISTSVRKGGGGSSLIVGESSVDGDVTRRTGNSRIVSLSVSRRAGQIRAYLSKVWRAYG